MYFFFIIFFALNLTFPNQAIILCSLDTNKKCVFVKQVRRTELRVCLIPVQFVIVFIRASQVTVSIRECHILPDV